MVVADEWCNTLEDIKEFADRKAGHMVQIKTPDLDGVNNTIEVVLYCKEKGIGAYQGGTCNETDRSAQVCAHCAVATQPVQILAEAAEPGMGIDEGYMIVYNEINRLMTIHQAKKSGICHGFMAIDPAIFGDPQAIKDHLSNYLAELRNSPKAEGQARIYTHGEKEVEAEKKLMENGIPVNDNTMVEVYEMCQYLDMDFSKYFGDYVPEASAGLKSPETFK